jgi:hypothetical protein
MIAYLKEGWNIVGFFTECFCLYYIFEITIIYYTHDPEVGISQER